MRNKLTGKICIFGGEMIVWFRHLILKATYGEVQKLLFDHIQIPTENIHRIVAKMNRTLN